ncbi:hypothetical protein SAMD00019534_058820 [Acytostelium subglobosum LB1]|uniref:hypothetical protein n=1 Tax=Acytostelium subglobosum LB1 TaxID=1410327 RepID=UPI0006448E16|nr:hypothetical protein SAMD00019534_058820 [Acytostelium subglobosum LB1]GAM22707.1 hypothetical protein SAMD00019534_058820 [Acytostelium subglobosum LB1]|eukprot:XP_012753934.1 hypothetical protein SAMD00019534_058820 [Acytostelium subglobosum LB1]
MSGSGKDVKVVVLGLSSVGKSCLVHRCITNQFEHTVMTVGGTFSAKKMQVGNTEVVLGIWDTAGTERYESVNRSYYRRAKAAIICYDITNAVSLDKVTFWAEELTLNEPNIDIYIVGTKLDLIQEGERRVVQPRDVQTIAEKYQAMTFETSSKTGQGVQQLLQAIAETYCRKYPNEVNNNNVNLSQSGAKSGGCC